MVVGPGGISEEAQTEIEDAGKVQTLASKIVRLITQASEVKGAGDVYISPIDPDIAIPVSAVDQKAIYEDPVADAWREIQTIAAGH